MNRVSKRGARNNNTQLVYRIRNMRRSMVNRKSPLYLEDCQNKHAFNQKTHLDTPPQSPTVPHKILYANSYHIPPLTVS